MSEITLSTNPASIINCIHYDNIGQPHNLVLEQISETLASESGFIWLSLHEPEITTLKQLQQMFGLHDLAVEDAQSAHQRPKIESYGDSLFIVIHTAQLLDAQIQYGETHAFLGARYVIFIRHGISLSYNPAHNRVEREPELLSLGASYGLYTVFDHIVDNYQPIISEFRDQLDALEKDIFADSFHRSTVVHLYELKRELTQMQMVLSPLQDVLSQLTRTPSPLIPEEIHLYFRDVLDHAIRSNTAIDRLQDMLTTAINVNLSLVTFAQGETVKRLGAWAALLAVPTLITGWYGMNFTQMPELAKPYAYPILIGTVIAISASLYTLLKHARWL